MHKLNWSDLQYVLAVAEQGSLASAARALGVNHTTVLRRVAAFEQQLSVRLFDRLPAGYVLTSAGEELARAARTVEETVASVERRVVGRDLQLTGTIRVTTTDTLAATLLPEALHAFSLEHPALRVELTTTTANLSLTRRDADVAVRPTQRAPANLVGQRVASVAYALYAAPAYLKRVPARTDLKKLAWLAPDDSLAGTSVARWMNKELRGAQVSFRADTLTALCHAARAGFGVAALPCFLGDRTPPLRRLRGVVPEMATELWVLTHADLRGAARIRALTSWLAEWLRREKPLLEGQRPMRE